MPLCWNVSQISSKICLFLWVVDLKFLIYTNCWLRATVHSSSHIYILAVFLFPLQQWSLLCPYCSIWSSLTLCITGWNHMHCPHASYLGFDICWYSKAHVQKKNCNCNVWGISESIHILEKIFSFQSLYEKHTEW